MKITGLEIERFGVWSGLAIPKLSPGLNVFYGGNEAGKSTVMEFIRSQLYGYGDQRRRYAKRPGGPHGDWNADYDHEGRSMYVVSGGSVKLNCPSGDFRLRRIYHPDGIEGREEIDLRTADGSKEKAQLLRILTCGIDEGTFNNVFAIGLDELQKLGSLSDTEAAEMLFRLSVGMDRISIVDSIKELKNRRNRVLDIQERDSKPSLLTRLLRQREKILTELNDAQLLVRDYVRLRNDQKDIDRTIANIEDELAKLNREKRLFEIARQADPVWSRRDDIRKEINAMGQVLVVSDETVAALDEIAGRREKKQFAFDRLKEEFKRAKEAIKAQPVNETLWKLTPKVEMMLDEEKRILELDKQISDQEKDIAALETRIIEEETQIKRGRRSLLIPSSKKSLFPEEFFAAHGVDINAPSSSSGKPSEHASFSQTGAVISATSTQAGLPYSAKGHRPYIEKNELIDLGFLDDYRTPARAVRKTKKRYLRVKELYDDISAKSRVLAEKIDGELARRESEDLSDAVNKASETVNLLRRRQMIGQKLAELALHHRELHRINTFLMQHQALPVWLLVLLGLLCTLCAIPIGIVLYELGGVPVFEERFPVLPAIMGLFIIGGVTAFKIITEKHYARQLAQNQRQLGDLMTQIERGKQEVASVDARLPAVHTTIAQAAAAGGKPIDTRIQEAQQELAHLEKLLPVDAERREVDEKLKKHEKSYKRYKNAHLAAKRHWADWLKAAGLPEDWNPARIRDLLEHCDVVGDMKRELDFRYESMNQRIRDMRLITDRIDSMILETGLSFEDGMSYVDILTAVRKKMSENTEAIKQRDKLKLGIKEFHRMRKKAVSDLHRVRRDEWDLFRQYGVKSSDELRELHKKHLKHRRLLQQEQGIQRELDAAIGGFCEESVVGNLLEPRLVQRDLARRLEDRYLAERAKLLESEEGLADYGDDYPAEWLDDEGRKIEKLPALEELIKTVVGRIDSASTRLHEELEQRGKLTEQLNKIAADRTTIQKQRELAVVEQKIRKAEQDWQNYAACGKMLDFIRATYEKERQPRTLAEASEILRKLTNGKYHRIWTPLGDETLLLDDDQGQTFDIAWLSRGTREQLFIALRLALVSAFAQHGSMLPLIMDDVLVDFDTNRATATARVLLDLAKAGRQILLFTCHEQVCRIFQKLDVPVRILPPPSDPGKGLKVLLPRSILKKREEVRRKELARLSAEKSKRLLESELAKRADDIRLDALRKAEVQRLILQMQQQATADKAVQAQQQGFGYEIPTMYEATEHKTTLPPRSVSQNIAPVLPPSTVTPQQSMDDYFEEDEE